MYNVCPGGAVRVNKEGVAYRTVQASYEHLAMNTRCVQHRAAREKQTTPKSHSRMNNS